MPDFAQYAPCMAMRTQGNAATIRTNKEQSIITCIDFDLACAIADFINNRNETPQEYKNGPLRFVVKMDQFYLGDEPINFTRKKRLVVEYFIKNVGRVIPTREIMGAVWGIAYDSPNYFQYLRVSLGDIRAQLGDSITIRNVLGVGYIMEEANGH